MEHIDISEKVQLQVSGLKWLAELELTSDPQLINNIKLNILTVSPKIKETEILSSSLHGKKQMLVWLDLNFWFFKGSRTKKIINDVKSILVQILPSYEFRVVSDYSIMLKSIEYVKSYFVKQASVEKE